jgi:C4-dicarboxylate-specific signal transduction histidine kinase
VDTLSQKAGVPKQKLRRLVLKELVDNALDAGAKVEITEPRPGLYVVRDFGAGIDGTPDEIARLFSINRPLVSSKLLRMPQRGALGNGLRVVAGAVAASGGSLRVTTRGRRMVLTPQEDGSTIVETQALPPSPPLQGGPRWPHHASAETIAQTE